VLNIGSANVNYSIYQSGILISPMCLLTSISPSTTVTCSITGLTQNTSYNFSVVATNINNSSITSNTLTVITVPVTAATGLTATISSATAISLNWNVYSVGNQAVTYNVYASTSSNLTTSTGSLFCSNISITSCSDTQVLGSNLSVGTTYYFILVVKNSSGTSIASNYLSPISISFSSPINISAPTLNGTGLSSSGIISAVGNVLTATQGTWSNAASCVNKWYSNNSIMSSITGTTYTTQSSDSCKVFSYCVSCSNPLGTTTSCSGGSAATNGINTANILSSYASRVETVSGYTLTAAGQTQIQSFLDDLITNNIHFPDVMYAMRNQQNAGTGTTLYDLYCNSNNATISSSTFTWDTKGILGDSTKSTASPYYGIAVSPSIFSTSLPSTQIAVSKTPVLNAAATQYGIFGYTSLSGTASGYGFGYSKANSMFDQISGSYNYSYNDAFIGKFNFVARSLDGTTAQFKINSLTNSYSSYKLGGGAFVIGNYTSSTPNSSYQINGYMSFAAAYTSIALTLPQMEILRQAYNSTLGQAMPFNAYIGSYSNNTFYKCNISVTDNSIGSCATTGSGFNGSHHIKFNKGFAYVVNYASYNNGSVSVCIVNVVDGTLSNCSVTLTGLTGAIDIGFNDGYAYITNANSIKIYTCNVSESTGLLSGCVDSGANSYFSYSEGMVVYNGYLYVENFSGNVVKYCTLNLSNGKINTCQTTGDSSLFVGPRGISIYNNYAYISNIGNGTIVSCRVNPNGTLSGCATTGTGVTFSAPDQMSFTKDGLVYIDDYLLGSIVSCKVNSNGTLTGCARVPNTTSFGALRGMGVY
jgi:hypothetical protein